MQPPSRVHYDGKIEPNCAKLMVVPSVDLYSIINSNRCTLIWRTMNNLLALYDYRRRMIRGTIRASSKGVVPLRQIRLYTKDIYRHSRILEKVDVRYYYYYCLLSSQPCWCAQESHKQIH